MGASAKSAVGARGRGAEQRMLLGAEPFRSRKVDEPKIGSAG
ncbi:hypothetical protein HMPREF9404_4434 [Eggerthella sp. HGA1]|nr:hypothetical protein HMPREF9404_4434 [Eggerthella sp. HGA1]